MLFRRSVTIILGILSGVVLAIWPTITDSTKSPTDAEPDLSVVREPRATFPITVRYPTPSPGVATGIVDVNGRAITVACEVCHSMIAEPPSPEALGLANLKDFHRGLVFEHGNLTCQSCHDPGDARSFRLANGTPVEPWDVIDLCSQCHGPQRKDFDHGAHGGMSGYWDLSRGPRTRNACTACHSPHAPKPGEVRPTFKPIDRFLTGSDPDHPTPRKDADHE
ncbi:MAG: hypothetical protein KDA27_13495 [Candidatus Eisenbacteria bacterium]|uniref:Cytochrome c7-like domain-containing protein n=1 Tax=Eiseniibacteriota bacterium TaxID=2212470 RepID=A0A956NCR4_UNCEI|nr:hypothetical protein [Candidatus Eisenbacteria bacterium]